VHFDWHGLCIPFRRRQLKKSRCMGDAMTIRKQNGLMAAVIAAAVFAAQAMAQNSTQGAVQQTAVTADAAVQQASVKPQRVIVVSLEDHKLALVEDGKVVKTYTVAVGKPSTPSPVGTFTISRRVMNPTYSHDGRTVAPGPENPVGTRWMGLSVHGYGIHGTNVPSSIGKAASHGCIRMAKRDLEELYALVQVGDTVELIGERNEETAELFGGSGKPVAAPQAGAQLAVAPATAAAPAAQPATTASATATATGTGATGAAGSL
jgi:lipoprotein-anchoring transpeptidase ErfK/SrfK